MVCELRVDAEGSDAVVVRAGQGADAARLRAEGERLRAATHPGVVQLLGSDGDDEVWELRMAHGGRPLDVAWPLPLEVLAGVIAAVATTLADLHDLGLVHGRLRAGHILLGPHGRPLLCGFGPGPADGEPAPTPSDDVAALGAVVTDLLGTDADVEPIPDRRWQRRRAWAGGVRRSLLILADQACAEPPSRRPSARRLAAGIAEAVPGATTILLPGDPPPPEPPTRRAADPIEALRATVDPGDDPSGRPRARAAVVCLALGALVLLVGIADAVRERGASQPSAAPTSSTSPPATPATDRQPTTVPPAAPVETAPQPLPSPPCAVPGCAAGVTVEGTVVTVGHRRFEVGLPGDRIAVGDWDCDGEVSPALLRPASGDVFVFAEWAADQAVTVRPVATVPGARELVADDLGDGCHSLGVRLASGELVPITRRAPA